MDDILLRYPQLELFMKSQQLLDLSHLWIDSQGNEKEVDIEGFKLALCHVDAQMKTLPATAQVYDYAPFHQ